MYKPTSTLIISLKREFPTGKNFRDESVYFCLTKQVNMVTVAGMKRIDQSCPTYITAKLIYTEPRHKEPAQHDTLQLDKQLILTWEYHSLLFLNLNVILDFRTRKPIDIIGNIKDYRI